MKKITYLILFISASIAACKKSSVTPTSLASINVTNAVVGGATLTLNTSALTISNNSYSQLTLLTGQSTVNLYPSATLSTPYYSQTMATSNGDYYSLFLTGASPSAVDNILIKESYKNYTDSLCGVRFINLSPGINPISVNVTGAANASTVASLAYKAYSGFIQFPAKKVNTSYAFQFRDATTGTLIASYTLATPYFNNVTIALRGLPAAPAVLLIKNY